MCVCVCVCVCLVRTSQVVGTSQWWEMEGSQAPRMELGFVVLGPAWSSWEGEVGAGKRLFRMDHQARLRGSCSRGPHPTPVGGM